MTTELKPHEILASIRERVTPATHEYLCGVCDAIEQELIGIAQRQGIDAAVAEAEALAAPDITAEDKRTLGSLATKDDAGRHFTETHSAEWLDRMEAAGIITISRPTHPATGIPYSQEYWSVHVSAEVADWFDEAGNLIED